MRGILLPCSMLLSSLLATAQTVLLSETFDTGTVPPGWFWFGLPPQAGPGYDGEPFSFQKESPDLSSPAPPAGAPAMAFHPIPYNVNWQYSLSVAMQLMWQGGETTTANCALVWADTTTGEISFTNANLYTMIADPGWSAGHTPYQTLQAGPSSIMVFGVMLTLPPSTVSNWANFDNLMVSYIAPGSVALAPKLWLDGAYDQGTGLMRDDLRIWPFPFPWEEPYSALLGGPGGEIVTGDLRNISGSNAIVDWVRFELRSTPSGPSVGTCNALVQRDGDVVSSLGAASIQFNVPAGSYYVVVRHRNHLGVMTALPVVLSSTPTTVDFRSPATALYTRPAPNTDAPVKSIGTQRLLWAGNAVVDERVKYTGVNNDRDGILAAIGGSVPTNVLSGQYRQEDVNLDGAVRYTGLNNDRDIVLQTIGGSTPTVVRVEQVP
jgi:hypothetical protein